MDVGASLKALNPRQGRGLEVRASYTSALPQLEEIWCRFRPNPYIVDFESVDHLDPEEKDIIASVFRACGRKTGIQLSSLTHQPGTPWHDTWTPELRGATIPNDLIAEHYRRIARERGIVSD